MKTKIIYYLLLPLFMVAFAVGCNKGDSNNEKGQKSVNEIFKPNTKAATLSEKDKAILDKYLRKYTVFAIDTKELAEFLSKNKGVGKIQLSISEELGWFIDLEVYFENYDPTCMTVSEKGKIPCLEDSSHFKGFTSKRQRVEFMISENKFTGNIKV